MKNKLRVLKRHARPLKDLRSMERYGYRIIEEHCLHLQYVGKAPGTISQRRRKLKALQAFAATPLLNITADQIEAFLSRGPSERGRPTVKLCAETRANELFHFRSFYKWALMRELIDRDPSIKVATPKRPRKLPRPMPTEDVDIALQMAEGRLKLWLLLAVLCGLRSSEIAAIRGEDILWNYDPPTLIVSRQKGGDEGQVPLPAVIADMLKEYPHEGWLFPNRWGTDHIWHARPSEVCNDYLHGLGIRHTLHTLRHYFGTELLNLGANLREVQELMRHKSSSSTELYTLVTTERKAKLVSALEGKVVA